MNTPTKETLAKYLQLQHWNKVLYEKVVITQREYLKMANMIRQSYPLVWNRFPLLPQLSIHTLCASGQNTPTESTSHPPGSERFPKRKRRE